MVMDPAGPETNAVHLVQFMLQIETKHSTLHEKHSSALSPTKKPYIHEHHLGFLQPTKTAGAGASPGAQRLPAHLGCTLEPAWRGAHTCLGYATALANWCRHPVSMSPAQHFLHGLIRASQFFGLGDKPLLPRRSSFPGPSTPSRQLVITLGLVNLIRLFQTDSRVSAHGMVLHLSSARCVMVGISLNTSTNSVRAGLSDAWWDSIKQFTMSSSSQWVHCDKSSLRTRLSS